MTLLLSLRNFLRARRSLSSHVLIDLSGQIEELPTAEAGLLPKLAARAGVGGEASLSVASLRSRFERLASDRRVRGVVLRIECEASPAVYQSLRAEIERFRASGRRVIAYAERLDPFQYYLACACDAIVMPPSAEWGVVGVAGEYIFFKDLLARLGIGVDVVNVSPYKSAGDTWARAEFSPEARAQAESLLDARFDELVRGIAAGRAMTNERARAWIDAAPLGAREACAAGLIDAALYEDELEGWLATASPIEPVRRRRAAPRILENWHDAEKTIRLSPRPGQARGVGVVAIEGMIVRGQGMRSPIPLPILGSSTAGSTAVVQALRRAERDESIAAIVLFVNSGGGDALASDLIAREVRRVRTKKPVVAYLSSVAASGGYYVAALAQRIVAQPQTITGSIGVITIKPNTRGAFEKLNLHRESIARGANALLYSDASPLDEHSRGALERGMRRVYDDFKAIVAEGRGLVNDESLEEICGGRVWTAEQARERGLVDELGGFDVAVRIAAERAGLSAGGRRVGWRRVEAGRRTVLPPADGCSRS